MVESGQNSIFSMCHEVARQKVLYVVGTPIGNLADISFRALKMLETCDLVACEDTRVTGQLLKYFGIKKRMLSYREENEEKQSAYLVERLEAGDAVCLVSDAGVPGISDPGFRVVSECRKRGLEVVPIPGPSAFLSALSASGMPLHAFRFVGFLSPKSVARKRFLESIQEVEETHILYESTYRIEKFVNEMEAILDKNRFVCIARELTKKFETFIVGPLKDVKIAFDKGSKKGEFVVIIAGKDYGTKGSP